jgi:hypothetical protein
MPSRDRELVAQDDRVLRERTLQHVTVPFRLQSRTGAAGPPAQATRRCRGHRLEDAQATCRVSSHESPKVFLIPASVPASGSGGLTGMSRDILVMFGMSHWLRSSKMCYRAGKAPVDRARAVAAAWLEELP